jgi:hypothetical protein
MDFHASKHFLWVKQIAHEANLIKRAVKEELAKGYESTLG